MLPALLERADQVQRSLGSLSSVVRCSPMLASSLHPSPSSPPALSRLGQPYTQFQALTNPLRKLPTLPTHLARQPHLLLPLPLPFPLPLPLPAEQSGQTHLAEGSHISLGSPTQSSWYHWILHCELEQRSICENEGEGWLAPKRGGEEGRTSRPSQGLRQMHHGSYAARRSRSARVEHVTDPSISAPYHHPSPKPSSSQSPTPSKH